MRQQRLDRYFFPVQPRRLPTQPRTRATLLTLPVEVRARIYRHVGLEFAVERLERFRIIMNPSIDLEDADGNWCLPCDECGWINPPTAEQIGWDMDNSTSICRFCDRPPNLGIGFSAWHMFLVCRLFREELTKLYYSEARLEVIRTSRRGLAPLKRLGAIAIASLRDLTIRMNVCLCPNGQDCLDINHIYDSARMIIGHDEPLGKRPRSRNDREACLDLRDICAHLARFLPPNKLKMAFICEVEGYDLATHFMDALQQLPTLKSCTIVLSKYFDPRLRALAQDTQLKLTNPSYDPSKPFRLRELPRELQLQILRASGLIAPFYLRFHAQSNQHRDHYSGCVYHEPKLLTGDQISGFEGGLLPIACCCKPTWHTSALWTCNHWHLPKTLFLVDRQMEDDARTIMYSENTWVVDCGDLVRLPRINENWDRVKLPFTARIQQILPRFFAMVRKMQIEIPSEGLQVDHDPEDGWKRLLFSTLLRDCVPEKLDLTVVLDPKMLASPVLASYFFDKQRIFFECLIGGLTHCQLRNFTIRFKREYPVIPEVEGGLTHRPNRRLDELLDVLEMELVDTVPGAHREQTERDLRPRGIPGIPATSVHQGLQMEAGHTCRAWGMLPWDPSWDMERMNLYPWSSLKRPTLYHYHY